ncbi:MAG TPA: hypothetical protein DDZ51_24860 [Planctomycetaceae bacterium]|nr:hypothetical protein [Planctomycetaceae bacterium]
MTVLEQQLIEAYAAINATVDRILASAELKEQFRRLMDSAGDELTDEELAKRLLNLRKSGKLPRKFRQPR